MRIIAGTHRGRTLFAPKSALVRPAADKVKGALFNILGDIEGVSALDLFAGSGAVGLEALSRGAQSVIFVENLRQSLDTLKRNISNLGFENRTRIVVGEIPKILNRLKIVTPFRLVFLDPPYDKNLIDPTLESLLKNKLIDAQSWVIVEHSPREKPLHVGFEAKDCRQYGQTWLTFLCPKK